MTDQKPERRRRILLAAREVFAKEGFHSAEVKTIATRASVGKATIYKHFDSKEDLLLAVVQADLQAIRDIALTHLVGAGHPDFPRNHDEATAGGPDDSVVHESSGNLRRHEQQAAHSDRCAAGSDQ